MRNSTLTAFYTPPAIVRALAEALRDAGVVPRRLLDPSAGAGIFPSSFRETADGEVEILSFEKDLLTGQVLSALAREREQVVIDGFQTIESAYDSYFDVVTSNIPFGDTRIFDASFRKSDDPVRRQALKAVHNYFFIKGLDTLREGGILAFVTSAGVMDAPGNEPVRRYLMEHARLLSAVRLPNNLFTEYAGTEVASDLVVLQKQSEKRKLTPDEQRITDLLDCTAKTVSSEAIVKEDGIYTEGGFLVTLLVSTEQGVKSIDRLLQYSRLFPCELNERDCAVSVDILPIEVIPTLHADGSITARVAANAKISIRTETEESFISEVGKRTPREQEQEKSILVFCYPDKEESLWSIAKHYRTSPDEVQKSNPELFDERGLFTGVRRPILIKR